MSKADIDLDVLQRILLFLDDRFVSLNECARVNSMFNRLASKLLYRHVVYKVSRLQHALNLNDRGAVSEPSQLASACLARNKQYVLTLKIAGDIRFPRPGLSPEALTLPRAIQLLQSLYNVEFVPLALQSQFFLQIVESLLDLPCLSHLSLNSSVVDEPIAHKLLEFTQLQSLTLQQPTRAMLDCLPNWLRLNGDTLRSLHLKDNCGSVTPGVLKALAPPLKTSLRSFTLGLSYSLSDDDVWSFLAHQPNLEYLELQYYLQLRSPDIELVLPNLHTFSVKFDFLTSLDEAQRLCAWIERVTLHSPLQYLRLSQESVTSFILNALDDLADYLVEEQFSTLRVLDIQRAMIGAAHLQEIIEACENLEELHALTEPSFMDVLQDQDLKLKKLHTLSFFVDNQMAYDESRWQEVVSNLMKAEPHILRRVTINNTSWEGNWVSGESEGQVEFQVKEIPRTVGWR